MGKSHTMLSNDLCVAGIGYGSKSKPSGIDVGSLEEKILPFIDLVISALSGILTSETSLDSDKINVGKYFLDRVYGKPISAIRIESGKSVSLDNANVSDVFDEFVNRQQKLLSSYVPQEQLKSMMALRPSEALEADFKEVKPSIKKTPKTPKKSKKQE